MLHTSSPNNLQRPTPPANRRPPPANPNADHAATPLQGLRKHHATHIVQRLSPYYSATVSTAKTSVDGTALPPIHPHHTPCLEKLLLIPRIWGCQQQQSTDATVPASPEAALTFDTLCTHLSNVPFPSFRDDPSSRSRLPFF